MGDTVESFPLFPLGLVLLPQERIPLHIFEDRYRTMIGECLDAETRVRDHLALRRRPQGRRLQRPHRPGARALRRRPAEHPRARAPRPSGCCGGSRSCPTRRATWSCSTTWRTATPRPPTPARARYGDLVERVTDERPEADSLDDLDAYGMAATLDVAADAKQSLLEQRSESERLERLEQLFASALERISSWRRRPSARRATAACAASWPAGRRAHRRRRRDAGRPRR